MSENIEKYFTTLKATIDHLDRDKIQQFLDVLRSAYDRESTVFIFGNGGSAATASHIACDLNKGVSYPLKKKFKVIALTDNMATIMAYANDVSYDDIFVEQLKNYFKKNDVAIGISGSGNSKNVLKAIEYANHMGGITVGLSGYKTGRLKEIVSCSVNVNLDDMQISEDIHMMLGHLAMRIFCQVLHVPPSGATAAL